MQDITTIDSDNYVQGKCFYCPYDKPRICDCECCDVTEFDIESEVDDYDI